MCFIDIYFFHYTVTVLIKYKDTIHMEGRLKAHTDRTRFGNATRIFSFQ